jgi:hypothetical protein
LPSHRIVHTLKRAERGAPDEDDSNLDVAPFDRPRETTRRMSAPLVSTRLDADYADDEGRRIGFPRAASVTKRLT